MMRRLLLAIITLVALSSTSAAVAHKPSDSYLRLGGDGEAFDLRWDIALKDLELLLALDTDASGDITWREVNSRRGAIAATAMSHLQFRADGENCLLVDDDLLIADHGDGAYAVLMFATDCPVTAAAVTLSYGLLFDRDSTHRGLLRFRHGTVERSHVFTPAHRTVVLDRSGPARWPAFSRYFAEGLWHIWAGLDHILFLLTLLLPAVLIWRRGAWHPAATRAEAATAVIRTVTAFTAAHSLTLWLAAVDAVTLPSTLVESAIAVSIIAAAANNVYRWLPVGSWAVAFGLGLVHGFGFAGVLAELELGAATLAVALLGFNLGVEAGQLLIVAIVMPLAFVVRHTAFYQRGIVAGGSWLIAAIAMVWLEQRAT